jgi:predicted phosphoadenosine phosphosulfate sulfurtransferase
MTEDNPQHHKKKIVDQSVIDLARERVSYAFDLFEHIRVAFSGGKDSTVCLNLAFDEARKRNRLPLDVVFFDEEAIPLQTVEYVRRVSQDKNIDLRWFCVPIKHANACSKASPYWYPWAPEDKDLWVRELPPEGITELKGYDYSKVENRRSIPELESLLEDPQLVVGSIMGIRAQESLMRYRAVTKRTEENYIVKYAGGTWQSDSGVDFIGSIWKVYPIYDWSTEDVWTAPKKFGWDYNRAYDVMEKAGLSHFQQRCAPPFGQEPMRGLWTFAVCFPEIWHKMYKRVPGAATGARYGQTRLFAFGKKIKKPDNMSWQGMVEHFLNQWTGNERQILVDRIEGEIKRHYMITSEPILPYAMHPDTGLSWEWLVKFAKRGDFKNRNQANMKVVPEGKEKRRVEYDAELAKILEDNARSATGISSYVDSPG